jgi:regulator of sigma E protease
MPITQVIGNIAVSGCIFSTVVLVHEAGHFAAAKKCGVPVVEFCVGFPGTPVIATLWESMETSFTLRLLPFGGFVQFEDGAFEELSPGRNALILVAGSGCNLVSGFLLLVAGVAGYKGLPVADACVVAMKLVADMAIEVARIFESLSVQGIVGPVGMVGISHKVLANGLWALMGFTGIMSLSVGMMNLLPIPGFDGWHLLLAVFERISGRQLSRRFQAIFGFIGFLLVVALMVVVTYRDILRIAG